LNSYAHLLQVLCPSQRWVARCTPLTRSFCCTCMSCSSVIVMAISCIATHMLVLLQSSSGLHLQHTPLTRLTDFALAAVIPVHMHVGANGIVSDYVPPRFMGGCCRMSPCRCSLHATSICVALRTCGCLTYLGALGARLLYNARMLVCRLQALHAGGCWQHQASHSWGS
jgi:succinate dehydrogenase hydrophobic anchor subunit